MQKPSMCTEICAKLLKALLSEGVNLLQLILVLIVAVEHQTLCWGLPINNKQIHKANSPRPKHDSFPSFATRFSLLKQTCKGFINPCRQRNGGAFSNSGSHSLCPNAPVPEQWQMLKFLLWRICLFQGLQFAVPCQPQEPMATGGQARLSKPRELHFSGTQVLDTLHLLTPSVWVPG